MRLRLATAMPAAQGLRFTLGAAAIDARLGGGLEKAALHEVHGAPGDDTAAAAFAALLALRATQANGAILWVRGEGGPRLHAGGLAELGVDPATVLLVAAPDRLAALRAAADIVRCAGVAGVVIEVAGRAPEINLTATRRLALAAARSNMIAVLLRVGGMPVPTAARTRWRVAAAPSRRLAADAPGHPSFDVTLDYNRNGIAGFEARLEWNRNARAFRDATLPGVLPAVPADGTAEAPGRRAAA